MKSQDIDSLHIESAVNALKEMNTKILQNKGVKPREEQQIQEAFHLVHADLEPTDSQKGRRKKSYQEFLKRVLSETSPEIVALCAVALGKSRVANMRCGVRMSLPFHIKESQSLLRCTFPKTVLDQPHLGMILSRI